MYSKIRGKRKTLEAFHSAGASLIITVTLHSILLVPLALEVQQNYSFKNPKKWENKWTFMTLLLHYYVQ